MEEASQKWERYRYQQARMFGEDRQRENTLVHPHIAVRGSPLDISGGGDWSFCLAILIYFTREMESLIFVTSA